VLVMIQWIFNFITRGRYARLITEVPKKQR
jgi:hypothetical protein